MIDSGTVTAVANEAKTVIDLAYVAILAIVGFVTYFIGLIRGKKSAAKPAEEPKK